MTLHALTWREKLKGTETRVMNMTPFITQSQSSGKGVEDEEAIEGPEGTEGITPPTVPSMF